MTDRNHFDTCIHCSHTWSLVLKQGNVHLSYMLNRTKQTRIILQFDSVVAAAIDRKDSQWTGGGNMQRSIERDARSSRNRYAALGISDEATLEKEHLEVH